jgi:hypothetical protein
MDENIKEKMLDSYERRLKSTKERHKVEIESLTSRQENEIRALEHQYKSILKLDQKQVN